MALHALEDIDDAIAATRRFLLPFDRVRWLRLAVVMFFIGGAGGLSFPSFPGTGSDVGSPETPSGDVVTPDITAGLVALIVAVVALVFLLALGYMLVGSIMEFVFVESLGREEVRLKASVTDHWRKGARLFVFRVLVQILSVLLVGGLLVGIGAAMGGWPPTAWSGGTILAVILLAIPVLFLYALVFGTFLGFTTVFVVPIMLKEGRGVVGAWKRFWPTLVGQWKQYLVYAIMGFLLSIAVGIAVGFLGLIALVVLAIPFLIVGVPVVVVLGFNGAGAAVVLVLVVLFIVLMLLAGLLIQVPFQTFLRYYALFVLGDTNEEFDVIAGPRAAVRADGGDRGTDDGDGDAGTGGGDEQGDTTDGSDDSGGDDGDGWNVDRDDGFDR